MTLKWIGAFFVVLGCGGFGFSLAAAHRREIRQLRQLIRALEYMQSELSYHLTPLPELCGQAGREAGGTLMRLFQTLSQSLEQQFSPDVASCMLDAISRSRETLTPRTRKLLAQLGRSLGRFDLAGQLRSLASLQRSCQESLAALEKNKEIRLRSYQTLGLCAGAALAILFA